MMSILQKIKATFAAYPFVAVCCTWALILAVAYLFLSIQVALYTDKARKTGIETIQQLSKKISLPLLEKNTDRLQSALTEAGQQPGVVMAWVVDHQNKVVAFTGSDPFLPLPRASDTRIGDVEVWQAEASMPAARFNLVSAVTYAGTRIGKIHLALAADPGSDLKGQFMRILILSGLFVLVLTAAFYRRQLTALASGAAGGRRAGSFETADYANASVACPLCGGFRPFAKDIFQPEDPDAIPAVSLAGPEPRKNARRSSAIVYLHELETRPDLVWYKRRIILRCADIIRILST
jgi:hypothetical protein